MKNSPREVFNNSMNFVVPIKLSHIANVQNININAGMFDMRPWLDYCHLISHPEYLFVFSIMWKKQRWMCSSLCFNAYIFRPTQKSFMENLMGKISGQACKWVEFWVVFGNFRWRHAPRPAPDIQCKKKNKTTKWKIHISNCIATIRDTKTTLYKITQRALPGLIFEDKSTRKHQIPIRFCSKVLLAANCFILYL